MAKYIRKFNSVETATAATDLVSPNVTLITGGGKLLMLDTGVDDTPLEIKESGGTIIIEEKPSNPSFTIDGMAYYYESGMTWAQWVNSTYNTAGYKFFQIDSSLSDACYYDGIVNADGTLVVVNHDGFVITSGNGMGYLSIEDIGLTIVTTQAYITKKFFVTHAGAGDGTSQMWLFDDNMTYDDWFNSSYNKPIPGVYRYPNEWFGIWEGGMSWNDLRCYFPSVKTKTSLITTGDLLNSEFH